MKFKKLDNLYKKALAAADNSPDAETKVGAILINIDSGADIASGYNGFCRGCDDDNLPNTRPEKYEIMVHAEENLIFNCARHGINTSNCFVFCTLSPCTKCTRSLYQSNIKIVYFKDEYRDFQKNCNMKDLYLKLSKIGDYTKMEIFPREGRNNWKYCG